jgi:hypothetical protein
MKLLGLFLFLCGLVAIVSPDYSNVLGFLLLFVGGWMTFRK